MRVEAQVVGPHAIPLGRAPSETGYPTPATKLRSSTASTNTVMPT